MTTEERLETLERKVEEQQQGLSTAKRRNKYLLLGLVVLAIAWASTTTMTQIGKGIVRAEKFELVDSHRRVCARLAVLDEFGSGLFLYDKNGTTGAAMFAVDNGPMLALSDKNGTPRAILAVSDDGPGLSLYDANALDANALPIWSAP
jgi:hypothetical protein